MSDTINIHYYNATYIQISCENRGVLSELSEHFTFEIENARFNPLVENHLWDGKIRMFNLINGTIYAGLLSHVIKFIEDRKYEYTIEDKLFAVLAKNNDFNANEYIKSLNIRSITPHDYQISAVEYMIRNKRTLCISPTSSGKSFLMYCLIRWYLDNLKGKILIIVPLVDLVKQLVPEFETYSDFDIQSLIHTIYDGSEKNSNKRIFISTWQSIYKMPKKYFEQFSAIIGDEIHETGTAKSSKGIFDKSTNAHYRIGLTGTIKKTKVHRLVLEGVTGQLLQVTTTKKLMDEGKVSKLAIKCVVLKYSDSIRNSNKKMDYNDEQHFITKYAKRNEIIAKLAIGIKDENVLILSKSLDHIELLKKELENCGKTIFVITGDTDGDIRLKNKLETEVLTNVIIIATEKIFSTGISIKNLQNLIMTTGGKSNTRILQSIGRILRLDGKFNKCTLYDFVDDFSYKKKKNYMLAHFLERVQIYSSEKFEFVLININL